MTYFVIFCYTDELIFNISQFSLSNYSNFFKFTHFEFYYFPWVMYGLVAINYTDCNKMIIKQAEIHAIYHCFKQIKYNYLTRILITIFMLSYYRFKWNSFMESNVGAAQKTKCRLWLDAYSSGLSVCFLSIFI